METVLSV